MSRLLRLTQPLRMRVDTASLRYSKNRYERRWNMMDEDRIKWYNMNLLCVGLTVIPLWYLRTVQWHTSKDTEIILKTLDATRDSEIKYTREFFN